MKFFIDAEWLECLFNLSFIDDVTSYDNRTDFQLRVYLERKAETSRTVITLDLLDEIVTKNISMRMNDADATSRIEKMFMSYMSLLRRYGLS